MSEPAPHEHRHLLGLESYAVYESSQLHDEARSLLAQATADRPGHIGGWSRNKSSGRPSPTENDECDRDAFYEPSEITVYLKMLGLGDLPAVPPAQQAVPPHPSDDRLIKTIEIEGDPKLRDLPLPAQNAPTEAPPPPIPFAVVANALPGFKGLRFFLPSSISPFESEQDQGLESVSRYVVDYTGRLSGATQDNYGYAFARAARLCVDGLRCLSVDDAKTILGQAIRECVAHSDTETLRADFFNVVMAEKQADETSITKAIITRAYIVLSVEAFRSPTGADPASLRSLGRLLVLQRGYQCGFKLGVKPSNRTLRVRYRLPPPLDAAVKRRPGWDCLQPELVLPEIGRYAAAKDTGSDSDISLTAHDEAKPEKVEAKAEQVQVKAEQVQAKAHPVQAKAEHVQVKPEHVQAKANQVQAKPNQVQPKGDEKVKMNVSVGVDKVRSAVHA